MADRSPKDTVDELKTMVVDYARQETLDPLKHLGLWTGFGVAGAICLAIGAFLSGLGLLRLLQTISWVESEGSNFTWLPYLLVFCVLAALIALCGWAATQKPDWLKDLD